MKKIDVFHGPNLNLLGNRENEIYGHQTLEEINHLILEKGKQLGLKVTIEQTNSEEKLINWVQACIQKKDGLIINPAAFTHTSIAIRDALAALTIPKIEVHLSNPMAREVFRRRSLVSAVVDGTISGFGAKSYLLALEAIQGLLP